MKLNTKKTQYMIINFTDKYQFNTRLELDGNLLEEVSKARLLGVHLDNKLSWQLNTTSIVQRAYMRMKMLHKLHSFEVPVDDLICIYTLYIRSILESSAVVWHSSLTVGQELEIERVQKVALKIILKSQYTTYDQALKICNLVTLKQRREHLCLSFAKKCTKSERNRDMFPLKNQVRSTRKPEKYQVTFCHTDRLKNSAIPYMQKLLNANM